MRRKKKETQHEPAGFVDEPGAVAGDRRRLTPANVQEKVFRLSFRGYNEQDVDRFLDEVTEELAAMHEENKRLRERTEESGGMASTEILREAERRAGETVRQAREYAARLMEDAGARAGDPGVASRATAPPASFLIRERDFLQQLASLIQEHAEALKAGARETRTAEPSPAATPRPAPEAPEQETAPPPAPMDDVAVPSETTQAHEPFLDDWEGTFAGGSEEKPFAGSASDLFPERPGAEGGERRKDREEEPSLRELFWGEE